MKTKTRVLMMLLAVSLLGVLILGFQGVIPMPMAMNVVVTEVFLVVLLALTYKGQINVEKKVLLSLVIEAE